MVDDNVESTVKSFDSKDNTVKDIDLYDALCILEDYARSNNIEVAGFNKYTSNFVELNKNPTRVSVLTGIYIINSHETEPEWWSLNSSISEECMFTYNCLINGIKPICLNYIGIKLNDCQEPNNKKVIDTFIDCNAFLGLKNKDGYLVCNYDKNRTSDTSAMELDKILKLRMEYPQDYYTRI